MEGGAHPCLAQFVIVDAYETLPLCLTLNIVLVCKLSIMVVFYICVLYVFSCYHSPVLPTASNISVKCTKILYRVDTALCTFVGVVADRRSCSLCSR